MSEAEKRGVLGGIGHAFSDRNFRIYSAGSICSWTSFFIQLVAVAWLTWELTGSTKWLATMALLDIAPNVLLMPLTGAIADRFDRHIIMLITSTLLLLQATALAVLAWAGMLSIWPLAGLVLLHGVFISFMVPAMYGTLPRFVNRAVLPSAIAVSAAYTQFSFFAGPALSGWIIKSHGLTAAFIVNAVGYLALLISFVCLKTPADYEKPQPSSASILGDIKDGFAYIRQNETIWSLLWLALVADAVGYGFFHMLPAYSDLVLEAGIVGVSTLLAFRGLGATVAALWIAHVGASVVKVKRVMWAFLIAILALLLLVQIEHLYLAAGIFGVMGFASETRKTGMMTLIQLSTDEAQRGRVMGTVFMVSQIASGIGAYVVGAAAAEFGLPMPITIGAVIGLVAWGVVYRRVTKNDRQGNPVR